MVRQRPVCGRVSDKEETFAEPKGERTGDRTQQKTSVRKDVWERDRERTQTLEAARRMLRWTLGRKCSRNDTDVLRSAPKNDAEP